MFHHFIDTYFIFKNRFYCSGWVFHESGKNVKIHLIFPWGADVKIGKPFYKLPSPAVEERYGEIGRKCRFDLVLDIDKPRSPYEYVRSKLRFTCGKDTLTLDAPENQLLCLEPHFLLAHDFWELVKGKPDGRALEIGSRARSGISRRGLFPETIEYVGLDIMEGENVDVVGDAHELSKLFPQEHFDFVLTLSTFEHLFMPWVVAVEMNKVMKTGGHALIWTPYTWNPHDEPWDFFRFSKYAYTALFNEKTGFAVVDAQMGNKCAIVPEIYQKHYDFYDRISFSDSVCLIRKIGPTDLSWDVNVKELLKTHYPA